jgi:rhodanese-related sulfurtransferase
LAGRFAEYAGMVIPPQRDVVIVGDAGHGAEAKIRLGRIGFDQIKGALEGVEVALAGHPYQSATASRLTADQLAERLSTVADLQVLDVRNPGERELGAIDGSIHIPLSALAQRMAELDLDRPIAVHCAGGYRSSIAASVLRAAGAGDVSDLVGGYDAWQAMRATGPARL